MSLSETRSGSSAADSPGEKAPPARTATPRRASRTVTPRATPKAEAKPAGNLAARERAATTEESVTEPDSVPALAAPQQSAPAQEGATAILEPALPGASAARPGPAPEQASKPLHLPADRYLDRERSWIQFNERVLELAEDESIPLLERVRYLAIFASNLDEFFMVRVAG